MFFSFKIISYKLKIFLTANCDVTLTPIFEVRAKFEVIATFTWNWKLGKRLIFQKKVTATLEMRMPRVTVNISGKNVKNIFNVRSTNRAFFESSVGTAGTAHA
jgi:hypothetical protein